MKRTIAVFLLTIAATLAATAQDADRGVIDANNKLTSKTGRFAATLPAGFSQYEFETVTQSTDAGDILINKYTVNTTRGTVMIGYYDLPAKVLAEKTAQKILDDGRDGAIKQAGGVLKRDEAATVDGFPGKSIYVDITKGDTTIYARSVFVLVKSRVYNYLFVCTDESELYKADVKKYFDSFHITN